MAGTAAPEDSAGTASGGVVGNERLTGATAAVLFVLLFVEGFTVLTLGSTLSLHMALGVALIPPALLKIGTTGYRAVRYYANAGAYRLRGAPPALLRALGPVVVLSTLCVLGTGVGLEVLGPRHDTLRNLHKVSFIVFLGAIGIHVLAHLRDTPRLATADVRRASRLAGARARHVLVVATLVVGAGLGAVAIAYDGPWVHRVHDHQRDRGNG